jgi:hypothetical protein
MTTTGRRGASRLDARRALDCDRLVRGERDETPVELSRLGSDA